MDMVSELLSGIRLTGGIILDAHFRAPWRVVSGMRPEDCAPFFEAPEHLISYHFIREGRLWARVGKGAPVELGRGDLILFPHNDPHTLFCGEADEVDAHDLITPPAPGRLPHIDWGGDGEPCSLFCGFLGSDRPDRAVLDLLPPVLKVSTGEGIWAEWFESSMRLAASELEAGSAAIARLAEMMFAEALRRHFGSLAPAEGGSLTALRDPAVSRALAIIHSDDDAPIDMGHLAREAALSRSALAERFTALLGEPPIRYWTKRRLAKAADLLREGKAAVAEAGFRAGFGSEAAFSRAFKREYGIPPSAWRRRHAPPPPASRPAAQLIHYCTARDGVGLAYSCTGEGPPLVKTANWLNHLEFEWESPIWRHWIRELSREHMLLRYDERGNGLSDWKVEDLSFEAFVEDLETVVEAAGVERFDLLCISQGCAVGVAYAVRHPERVRRLVLIGGYSMGWAVRAHPDEVERREAMIALTRTGWGQDNPAFRQMFTTLYFPDATPEQAEWFNELQRVSASPEGAERLQRTLSEIDVRDLLPQVNVPTIVFHARDDAVIPFDSGRYMAMRIPGAQFLALDSANHILLEHEPAWPVLVQRLRDFLA